MPDVGHGKTQKLLLASKILDNRENASPFTLVIDSLEQTARPLLREYVRRAKISKVEVIFVSYSTFRPLADVDHFLRAYDLTPAALQQKLNALTQGNPNTRHLVILDDLNSLAAHDSSDTTAYVSSMIRPNATLVAVYHSDVPLPPMSGGMTGYEPSCLAVLRFLATTILTMRSFAHEIAEKTSRDRSLAVPAFGLHEDESGILQGLHSQDQRGIVLEMEHRRKSGRAIGALLFLAGAGGAAKQRSDLSLLDDHPLFQTADEVVKPSNADDDLSQVSFNLGLTDKQRRDREGVVLPYFDAQRDVGSAGEGGRIVYEMSVEDDFDEEEDEI